MLANIKQDKHTQKTDICDQIAENWWQRGNCKKGLEEKGHIIYREPKKIKGHLYYMWSGIMFFEGRMWCIL